MKSLKIGRFSNNNVWSSDDVIELDDVMKTE